MTTTLAGTWDEVRADMARRRVSTGDVASELGMSYGRYSTLLNSEHETVPTPEFVERIHAAIQAAAVKRGR